MQLDPENVTIDASGDKTNDFNILLNFDDDD